jgi:hypothetical protein
VTRLLFGGFLIVHGLIQAGVYFAPPPKDKPAPFDPGHSWILTTAHVADAPAHRAARAVAVASSFLFVVAGLGVLAGSSTWIPMTVGAAVFGLTLKIIYFHPWLILGAGIDVALVSAALASWPPSLG